MSKQEWSGLYPANALPFKENFDIDEAELRQMLSWQAGVRGVTGIVVNSHAGEVGHTTASERTRINQVAVDEIKGRVKVISGVAAEGSREATELAEAARDAGVDGLLVMPPHRWLRKGKTLEETVGFFEDIGRASGLPMIVHQYPWTTKATYNAEALVALSKVPGVVAVKMGVREFAPYERQIHVLRREAPHLALLTCHDEALLPSAAVGVDGAILGFATFVPELISDLLAAVAKDDWTTARQLNESLFYLKQATYGADDSPMYAYAYLKEAMFQIGRIKHPRVRPPVPQLTEAEKAKVQSLLELAGLLPVDQRRAA